MTTKRLIHDINRSTVACSTILWLRGIISTEELKEVYYLVYPDRR